MIHHLFAEFKQKLSLFKLIFSHSVLSMDQLRRRDSLNNVNGQIFVEFNLKSRNWGDHPTILTFDCMCVYIYMQKYIYIARERERDAPIFFTNIGD